MSFKFQIFIILMLSFFYSARCDPFDISLVRSLFTTNSLQCYKCSSLRNAGCKNITATSIGNEKLLEKCKGAATGCVKQWIRTDDGKIIIYRDCFYGPINLIKNFDCQDLKNHAFSTQRCYKCRGNLCNGSNRLDSVSTGMILFTTMITLTILFIIKL